MKKATVFKLSMLALMAGSTTSCNIQNKEESNYIEPELQHEIEVLEDLGNKQDPKKMKKIIIPDYLTPEYMNKLLQQAQENQK